LLTDHGTLAISRETRGKKEVCCDMGNREGRFKWVATNIRTYKGIIRGFLNYVRRMTYHFCATEQVQLQSLVMHYGIFIMILLWREKSKGNLLPSAPPRPVPRQPSGLNFLCTFGVYGS